MYAFVGIILVSVASGIAYDMGYGYNSQQGYSKWDDYDLHRVDNNNSTSGKIIDFDLRAKRYNRTTYSLGGSITFRQDRVKEHEIEFNYFYSSTGSNNFVLLPYKIARKPLCDFYNGEYRKYLMEDFHRMSKLPFDEDESKDLCPLFVGCFEIENFRFSKEVIPPSFEKGIYKAIAQVFDGDIIASSVEVFVKLY